MITSNAVGVYSDDGKHTAPPGHDNNSTCRPVSRHNRLIASRAASVTTRRPPRVSTRSEEPRERCTTIARQHNRYSHHNRARETLPPETPTTPHRPTHGRPIREAIPGAQLEIIRDCGHSPTFEDRSWHRPRQQLLTPHH
jgi:pimeloyl-ACP methyl ester carboxylesterase